MLEYFIFNALSLLGLIFLAYLVYHTGRGVFKKYPRTARIFLGIFAGVAGAFLMSQSYETSSGILVDYRNLNIGIAALFGGLMPAAVAAGIMFAYRILIIGFNQTTLIVFINLAILTVSGNFLFKYVKPLARQWAAFCTLNIAVTAIALLYLLWGQGNPTAILIMFFTGYALLSLIIYIILKLILEFDRTFSKAGIIRSWDRSPRWNSFPSQNGQG